jgi:hypothetical protein
MSNEITLIENKKKFIFVFLFIEIINEENKYIVLSNEKTVLIF